VVYILARVMSSSSRDCRSAISTMRKLILFDIDGTLVLTGGAGLRAMNRACADIAGNAEALSGIPVAGRTDRVILADVVSRLGRTLDDRLLDHLRERYLVHLREEIELPGRGHYTQGDMGTVEFPELLREIIP